MYMKKRKKGEVIKLPYARIVILFEMAASLYIEVIMYSPAIKLMFSFAIP